MAPWLPVIPVELVPTIAGGDIQAAGSLKELTELRKELFAYRVLDPACGSGNFLYVAFRELYRLDTELLSRMREFPSTHSKLSWNGGISAANFYGIDINPFAVELAKVTLNIAKKIAFEERKAQAFALAGQVEMDIDPSLPLDNLDQNILCADAIFTDWPEIDAIVGNPPFLGDRRIRRELGPDYVRRLQDESGADGVVDIACYFFRRAHDRLREGARAGLVSTSGIRVGKTREASLDYIVANGATITNAVSSRTWPGESAVNVSMVNWVKGPTAGPYELIVDDVLYSMPRIATHLQLHVDVSEAASLMRNEGGSSMGVIFGHEAFVSTSPGFPAPGSPGVRPMAGGDDLLRGKLPTSPDYCIYLVADEAAACATAPAAYDHLKTHLYPWMKARVDSNRETNHFTTWLRKWWRPQQAREDFMAEIARRSRVLVCPNVVSRPVFAFISTAFVPNPSLYVFAFDDDYTFGIVQSGQHWAWTKAKGSKVADRIKYTTPVWTTFPWPQEPTEAEVAAVAKAARDVRRVRDTLMKENGWSLRALCQAAEVEGPHPLKHAQAALDAAVAAAYGAPEAQDPLAFLLELNQLVAEDEKERRKVRGPGLPEHLDPKDPRWFSIDCIEPPPLEN